MVGGQGFQGYVLAHWWLRRASSLCIIPNAKKRARKWDTRTLRFAFCMDNSRGYCQKGFRVISIGDLAIDSPLATPNMKENENVEDDDANFMKSLSLISCFVHEAPRSSRYLCTGR